MKNLEIYSLFILSCFMFWALYQINNFYHVQKQQHHSNNKNDITYNTLSLIIVHFDDRKNSTLRDLSFSNHKEYAQKHNYSIYKHRKTFYPFVSSGWVKIVVLLDALSSIEYSHSAYNSTWLMWIDSDAIISNHSISATHMIQSILNQTHQQSQIHRDKERKQSLQSDYSAILSTDLQSNKLVNTGVMFVRRTL